MDVRCEKCLTEYEFDDAKVTEAGVTVKCTTCGFVFKVKRMVAPLPPGHVDELAPDQAHFDRSREWKIRQANGSIFTCRELTTLQKWIIERKIAREDEISLSGDQWKRLGDIPELAGFFLVVDQANKGQLLEQQMRQNPGLTQAPTFVSQGPLTAPSSGGYQMGRPPSRQEPAWTASGDDSEADDLRAIKRSGPGAGTLAIVLLLAAGGGAFFYLRSQGVAPFGTPKPAPQPVAATPPPAQAPTPVATAPSAIDAGSADAGTSSAATPGNSLDAGVDAGTAVALVADAGAPSAPDAGPAEHVAAAAVEPKAAPKPKTFDALIAEGARWERREKPERAVDAYDAALQLDPGSAEAWAGKGQALIDLSQYSEAEAAFRRALSIAPRFSDAEMGMADAYRYQGKKAAAIKQYKKYIEDHPGDEGAAIARNAVSQLSE